jgi:hypothetical protein
MYLDLFFASFQTGELLLDNHFKRNGRNLIEVSIEAHCSFLPQREALAAKKALHFCAQHA